MTNVESEGQSAPAVITIDGPSGTGKGTIARAISNWLGWHFLDSGALYRVLGLVVTRERLDISDEDHLVSVASNLDVSFVGMEDRTKVYHNGLDCTLAIRTEECGIVASRIAVSPAIRKALLSKQHAFRLSPGLVADGRDMGTVVFPDADLQIFMTASVEERARRRHNQLKEKEICASLADLSRDIKERDERDVTREQSPLKPSQTAVILDTTVMSVEEVTDKVKSLVRKHGLM